MKRHSLLLMIPLLAAGACGGAQTAGSGMEMRPLEENKALEIVASVLQKRGYTAQAEVPLTLSNQVALTADLRVVGHPLGILYLDAYELAKNPEIPPPAPGSRLHVIPATTVPDIDTSSGTDTGDTAAQPAPPAGEPLYVLVLKATDYEYQYNPTSQTRGKVTYLEVQNRLTRDLNDFVSWYESKPK